MKKVLYFDCETTGLDPVKNDIIQLAGIVECEGKVEAEFNLKCQPWSFDNVDPSALDVHGYTLDQLKKFPPPGCVQREFVTILGVYCNQYDRNDKFYPAGYNGKFDLDFVNHWFTKAGDRYWGSWQNWRLLDPLPFLSVMNYFGHLDLPNLKLETVAQHFGIEIQAHDALSDVLATRELLRMIYRMYKMEVVAS